MRFALVAALGIFSVGCSDYNVEGSQLPPIEINPPTLATPVRTDQIVQVTRAASDVLFVVDNSCSMDNNQKALHDNFPSFMDYFLGSGLDYHIGVVSTDLDDPTQQGKLQDGGTEYLWIDTETPDPTDVFTSMASLGSNGSGVEQGTGAAYDAVEVQGAPGMRNDGFVREDARLDIIVLSDEQDSTKTPSKSEFINYLLGLKSAPDMVGFSSIVNQPGCQCTLLNGETAGTDYIDVTNAVGGINWDIASNDWETVLEELGVQASGLKREFFLTELPVPGTVDVTVTDTDGVDYEFDEGADWTYSPSRNSVTFATYLPPALSVITITYESLAAMESGGA